MFAIAAATVDKLYTKHPQQWLPTHIFHPLLLQHSGRIPHKCCCTDCSHSKPCCCCMAMYQVPHHTTLMATHGTPSVGLGSLNQACVPRL